jgi:PHD/YefM family antitoxin component YafN of YafNO toxin-antitoxin module
MPKEITAVHLRHELGEILDRVANDRERFLIKGLGIPAAVLLSIPDFEDLQDLVDTWYEQQDANFQTSLVTPDGGRIASEVVGGGLASRIAGVMGLDQQQVTQGVDRVERAGAIAIMADLLSLRLRAQDIPADRPWSAFRLPRAFAWEVAQARGERSARQMACKWPPMGKAA